jgi:DNA-binding MarR family transcriptional regulator
VAAVLGVLIEDEYAHSIVLRYKAQWDCRAACGLSCFIPPAKDKPMPRPRISKAHYELLAELRHALRRFQRFSRDAARAMGLSPQQHQALLAIKGHPGRGFVSIGELAERLQVRHHSAVGLVDRLVRKKLVRRAPSAVDGRRVEVRLSPQGEAKIERLSAAHLRELRQLGPGIRSVLASMAAR